MQPDLEALKAQYGEVYAVSSGEVMVYCTRPSRAAFARYISRVQDRARLLQACEDFLRDCAVWPVGQELQDLCDRWPGAVLALAVKLAELAGAAEEAQVKAL